MPPELLWQQALLRSSQAQEQGALVPLATETIEGVSSPFVLRRLLSRTPKHLRAGGPKPNPFLPWDQALEVCRLNASHVLLLNKYPVQRGHLLVITSAWKPQSGWLDHDDWRAVAQVNADTTGLWFFNSAAAAGASQPHRHLQLLPRHQGEASCPMEPLLERLLDAHTSEPPLPWAYALTARRDPRDPEELASIVAAHCCRLELGSPSDDAQPRWPYNLLFCNRWVLSIRRSREHWAGFSINALGFAGYLLATERSDLAWLRQHGPWQLLEAVAHSSH